MTKHLLSDGPSMARRAGRRDTLLATQFLEYDRKGRDSRRRDAGQGGDIAARDTHNACHARRTLRR